ncbi:224_t:CDS:2 [Ambispora leptoticha]|uniref:224_t:CDS:1 n=1 Tax=Ambispora leptoticha TaxID=144679 RepID=A0A9N8Z361_9GLOM|nr:224_t:CDS:2 [Ambispora leptoticha]
MYTRYKLGYEWPLYPGETYPVRTVLPQFYRKYLKVSMDNIQKHENIPRTVDELNAVLKKEWSKFFI